MTGSQSWKSRTENQESGSSWCGQTDIGPWGPRGWKVMHGPQLCLLSSFLKSSYLGPEEVLAARASLPPTPRVCLQGLKGAPLLEGDGRRGHLCFTSHFVSLNEIFPCRGPAKVTNHLRVKNTVLRVRNTVISPSLTPLQLQVRVWPASLRYTFLGGLNFWRQHLGWI